MVACTHDILQQSRRVHVSWCFVDYGLFSVLFFLQPDHLSITVKIEVRVLSWLLGGVGRSHLLTTCIRAKLYSKVLA